MKNGKALSCFYKVISLLFSLVFFAIWLGVFLDNKDNLPRYDLLGTRIFFFILIVLIISGAFFKSKYKISVTGYILIVIGVQLFLLFNLYQKAGWDVDVVLDYAYKIANYSIDKIDLNHLEIYPNLSFLVTIYSLLFKVLAFLPNIYQYYLIAIISILCVDISLLLVYKICKLIFNRKVALISVILFTLFFAFSPWIMVPYSDTVSMPFPLMIFYLYLKSNDQTNKKKYALYMLIGLITIIGYLIKPQVIIASIAIIIILVFRAVIDFRRYYRNIIFVILLLLVMVSVNKVYSTVINKLYDNRIYTERNITYTHYLMMGLNERKGLYGAWNEEDFNYSMSFSTKQERKEGNLYIARQRLEDFGVMGYSNFIWKKANWVMGDATFFWMCEGAGFTKDLSYHGTKVQKYLRDFFYVDAPYFKVYGSYVTAIWLIILLFMLFPNYDRKSNEHFAIIKLSIVGIVMFTLLFEGRSRYLINYIPFFIMAASVGIFSLQTMIGKRLRLGENR